MTWSTLEKLHLDCVARRDRRTEARRKTRLAIAGTIAALAAVFLVLVGYHP